MQWIGMEIIFLMLIWNLRWQISTQSHGILSDLKGQSSLSLMAFDGKYILHDQCMVLNFLVLICTLDFWMILMPYLFSFLPNQWHSLCYFLTVTFLHVLVLCFLLKNYQSHISNSLRCVLKATFAYTNTYREKIFKDVSKTNIYYYISCYT